MFQLHAAELRSITAICVVEDSSKCPLGYTPIVRTHDQETDADLWKDGLFGRRVTRYVCVSKTQGRPEHVIQAIQILQDKELPPEGFSVIQQTTDTSQKAFKKKLLCFKQAYFKANVESIVDVVILNKIKNPPDGFDHIGDINGMHFFVKKVSAITRLSMNANPTLAYGASPGGPVYPSLHDSFNNININTNGQSNNLYSSDNRFSSSTPNTPAHGGGGYVNPNIVRNNFSNTATLAHILGAEGVPFVIRDNLRSTNGINGNGIGNYGRPLSSATFTFKTENDVEKEYQYDFRVERNVLINGVM